MQPTGRPGVRPLQAPTSVSGYQAPVVVFSTELIFDDAFVSMPITSIGMGKIIF